MKFCVALLKYSKLKIQPRVFILSLVFQLTTLAAFAQYTKLLDFDNTTNGGVPYGSLISDGTFQYVTTRFGGTINSGTVFKIKPDGTGFTMISDFASAGDGNDPQGALISDGTLLFGMTSFGGSTGDGTLFKIMPDGTGYVKLLDFAGATNGSAS